MMTGAKVKRNKTDDDDDKDLLSNLPRHIIDAIIDHLPLDQIAKMSILSHKWLDIWRSTPKLEFSEQFLKRVCQSALNDTDKFHHIVCRILLRHSGRRLRNFHLYIPHLYYKRPDVNQWISYLSRTDNNLLDITIQNNSDSSLHLSSQIFSCQGLETLELKYLTIPNLPANYTGFSKMVYLELDKITMSLEAFNSLIQGCPNLQQLILTEFSMDVISIDARNLWKLTVDGNFRSLSVRNVENLVSVDFGLQKREDFSRCKKELGRLLEALARSSTKLRKLRLRDQFVRVTSPLPTFEKLKKIDLSCVRLNQVDDFQSIISLFSKFPAMERLQISVTEAKHRSSDGLDYSHGSTLDRLCYADVCICRGSAMELKLIEFLLECSPILEKLSITASGTSSDIRTTFRPEVMFQLLGFRRASQNVQINGPDSSFASDDSSSDYD